VDGGRCRAERGERLRVGVRDRADVEAAEAVGDLLRPEEGRLHGHLLVQQHADEQREGVVREELVGRRVAGEVERARHAADPATPRRA
jgi:hypothetical protein